MGAGVMVIGVAVRARPGRAVLRHQVDQAQVSRLNPLEGAKRIFGPQPLWEGVKMLLKSALVGVLRVARDPSG